MIRRARLPARHRLARRVLARRPALRKAMANAGWLVSDQALRMVVGLAVGLAVARYLGPERLGVLSYSLALVGLLSAAAGLGLDDIVVRNVTADPARRRETLGTTFALKLGAGVLSWLGATVAIGIIRPDDALTRTLVAIIAAGAVFQSLDTIDIWFRSQVRSRYVVYAKNGAFLVASATRLLLVYSRAPLVAFAWVTLGEAVLAALGLAVMYSRRGEGPGRWAVNTALARSLLRDSWPLILSGMVTMVYMRIDQVMLREMVGEREVGLYSAAVRLAEVWYLIPMALVASVYPNLIAAKLADEALFHRRLQRLYDLMALLGYAIAIPGTLLAGLVVHWLYGAEYREAAPMLAILVWTTVFVNLGVARSLFLTAMNWTRVHLFTVAIGGAANVGLNLLLIPRWGGVGAAIATCIAYAIASYGACFLYRPLFPTGRMLTRALFMPRVT